MFCGQDRESSDWRSVIGCHIVSKHVKPPTSTEEGKGLMSQPLSRSQVLPTVGGHRAYALGGTQLHVEQRPRSMASVQMVHHVLG